MAIYLKYGSIDGEVTAEGHEKWIDVHSFQWGVGRGISTPTGAAKTREASAPSVSEIVVSKPSDIATIKLIDEALEGEGTDVTIDFCKTDKGKLEVYLSYKLTNTMLSGFSTSSGGDQPNESLSFNFTKVECNAHTFDETGAAADAGRVGYDLALAKMM
jgi:type VI secretion system secreted protein Hcp